MIMLGMVLLGRRRRNNRRRVLIFRRRRPIATTAVRRRCRSRHRQKLIVRMTSLADQLTPPTASILRSIVKVMALYDSKVVFVTQPTVVFFAVQHVDVDILRVDLDRVAVFEEPPVAAGCLRPSIVRTGCRSRAILEMIRMMVTVMVVIVMPIVGMMRMVMMMMMISGRGSAKILVVVNININNNDIVQMLINTVTIGTDNAVVVVSGSRSWSSAPTA